ncbi:hypothetical protein TBLA_0B04480 [Henningerozyma blattae CBS 6284]|uniref:Major facilitator superfamily (MFS) profile domain-containing protein n=1 Tax=Henningerozyma blattae (strain ATCC 34711 / CBS 6284 / DSM 70876 / NBRC 10599 / NRRL Y-10934 / UCD 77-7) TaxID=1071380 RepID=I2GYT2_HENB6|nr:hypothetical protein TBLA_0B04480 [Tetrapisispora blattae CBS 6284]CCH59284.1 hypothetical protein TBLA_0B04480 [Tetrapisispora blattae CBS 6284]
MSSQDSEDRKEFIFKQGEGRRYHSVLIDSSVEEQRNLGHYTSNPSAKNEENSDCSPIRNTPRIQESINQTSTETERLLDGSNSKISTKIEIENKLSNEFAYSTETEIEKQSVPEQAVPITEEIPYTKFTKAQQFVIFCIIVYIGFLGPMCGNIYIPALPILQEEFQVTTTTINGTVSIFMGLFAFMPLVWGMFADFGGRKFLYIISLFIFTVANILLASLPANIIALYLVRVLQVVGASAAISLGTGTVADISPPKHRGKSVALFMLGPNMGPIIAPIIAGLILMNSNQWRWLFGFSAICTGVALMIVIVILPETLRCIVGNNDPKWSRSQRGTSQYNESKEKFEGDREEIREIESLNDPRWNLCSNLGIQKPVSDDEQFKQLYPKPPKPTLKQYGKLFIYPPITLVSTSIAFLFSSYYGFSVTFAHFLKEDYNYGMLQIGGAYSCPGICMILGSQSGGWLSDNLRKRWLKKNEGQNFPIERRLVLQFIGIVLSIIGSIGYGWSIKKHYHIAIVLMFSGFLAFGLTWCNNTTMTYLTELIPRRVSGVIAVCSFFRNVGAAVSAAISMKLVDKIGVEWTFTYFGVCNLIPLFILIVLIYMGRKWKPIES